MIASTPVGARRQPATGGHATAVLVPEAGHARAAGDALRRIPGVRTATWPVPAGRAGLPRVIEAAIAGVAVRGALAAGPVFGAAVAALAWALTPYGVPLAAVMGATVALTGGLFAGGFAGFIIGLARFERLLLAARLSHTRGEAVLLVRGAPCAAIYAAIDGEFDVVGCCD